MEDWAEIRRLHAGEGLPIKEIARRLGISRNTVRAALRSDEPPRYERAPVGSLADPFEPRIRALPSIDRLVHHAEVLTSPATPTAPTAAATSSTKAPAPNEIDP